MIKSSDITNAFSNKKLLSGTVITATFVLIAIFGPFVVSNPVQPALDLAYLPPSLRFPLGTDNWGRSVLAELVWGSRISLTVGVVSATAATLIGTLVGLV
ncbi:MAG: ABC transporter permease, partial [Nitrososphaerota archaeon]|nr:ABC transporter permease [Nitrososphaerota archaeon]